MSHTHERFGREASGCHLLRLTACDVLLLLLWLPGAAPAGQYGGGSGTVENPFLIYTPDDFVTIGRTPADWNKHFKQMRDIDLSGYDEKNLTLIGRCLGAGDPEDLPFRGSYDGDDKTIANFRYRDIEQDYIALFRYVTGDLKNMKLAYPRVITNNGMTGALVAFLDHGTVTNCAVTGAVISGNLYVGGLVGQLGGGVSRCSVRGRVSGLRYVGGLVGRVDDGVINQSYSKAQVVGNQTVGGLVGATTRETAIVDSCYASGAVEGASYVGGLAGEAVQGRVWRCYATGRVTGNSYVGGLVGSKSLGQVFGCLWDMETSGQATSAAGVGKTTNEMKSIDTFVATNWDFSTVWTICDGLNYPVLFWQIPMGDLACPDGVTLSDFAWFAQNWWRRDCTALNDNCDYADFDGSGAVGYLDLAIFAESWLAGSD
jgi:hypothetical protein